MMMIVVYWYLFSNHTVAHRETEHGASARAPFVIPLRDERFLYFDSVFSPTVRAGLSGARAHAPPAPRLLPSLMDDLFLTKQAGKIAPWEYGRAATWKACWTSCTRRVTGPV